MASDATGRAEAGATEATGTPVPSGPDGPAAEYRRRREHRDAEAARRERVERMVSLSRLAVMLVLAVTAWLSIQSGLFSPLVCLLPLAIFVGLVLFHRVVLDRLALARRAASYYQAGLARIEDRWSGLGPDGERFLDRAHPYAVDLDLFGEGSLFQLLCTARTAAGEDCLATWLQGPATIAVARERQQAVAELRPRLDLREDLWRLGHEVSTGVHRDRLEPWAAAVARTPSPLARAGLAALAGTQVLGTVGWAALGWGPTLLLAALFAHAVVALAIRARVLRAIAGAEGAGRELRVLARLLARLEAEPFSSPLLRRLSEELGGAAAVGEAEAAAASTSGSSPSREIARLERLVELLESRKNPLFAPLALLLVWTPQLALATEAWRSRSGPRIGRWIAITGEIEALLALSAYAWEHPADPFPELVDGDRALFDGSGLAHPARPDGSFVRNDLDLGEGTRALVVSGSNMSGKSTFLRTVGVNAVLALAGGPVRARRLRLTRLQVGASIQIHDSLAEGQSRFYAEILRLRQILELAREREPVLFLLDEILHGTNSHDRRIGAEAVVRSLLECRTVGLVTTHDLALARIAEDPAVRAANVHFEDEIVDGRMRFDYRLRPGVVERSNALALMREVGLEV